MISVCIATYNGESYIEEQLRSILQQLGSDDEVLVSDDGSTDSTISIVHGIDDGRVKILKNEGRHGVVGNFANALRHAQGDYIFLSDQDDVWAPVKVATCVGHLKESILVLHNMRFMDSGRDFFSQRPPHRGLLRNLYKNSYTGCCMAFRRQLLTWILPIPDAIPMHDIWIGLQAEKHGGVAMIDDCLTQYRVHEGNVTYNGSQRKHPSLWRQISFRWRVLQCMLASGLRSRR